MNKKNKNQRQREWKRHVPKVEGVSFYLGDRIKSYMVGLDKESLAIYEEVLKISLLNLQPMIEGIIGLSGAFDSMVTMLDAPEANQLTVSYVGRKKRHDGWTYLAIVVDLQQEGAVGGVSRPSWLGNHALPMYTSALEGLAS